MPGVSSQGRPLRHEGGKRLTYYCSAYTSWYATLAIAGVLHVTGMFPLYTLIDEFGSIMTVAILSGFLNSVIVYVQAVARGRTHRLSGYVIYDFFMGAELNPRIGSTLDFKMFYEVRIPWFILFLVTASVAARQYETYGYVSAEVMFLLAAHFLYANACAKAEQLIITSW
jgi:delta24(24(1))-sterol reductase